MSQSEQEKCRKIQYDIVKRYKFQDLYAPVGILIEFLFTFYCKFFKLVIESDFNVCIVESMLS